MVELRIKPFLRGDDFEGEVVVEFLNEGEYVPIKDKDGTTKDVFNIDIKLPTGEVRTWSPNYKSSTYLYRKLGGNSFTWVGKSVSLVSMPLLSFGKMTNAVYVKGSV